MRVYYHERGGQGKKALYDRVKRYNIPKDKYRHLSTTAEQFAVVNNIVEETKRLKKMQRNHSRAELIASASLDTSSADCNSSSNKVVNVVTSPTVENETLTGSRSPSD